jgi:hypothetical protein
VSQRLGARIAGLLVVAGTACLLAASASAGLGWNEAAKSKGAKVMIYTVDSVTFNGTGWSARVSFRNVSHATIGVRSEFGVAFFADAKTEDLARMVAFAPATKFSTKLPTSLRPGDSWTGTIGGTGKLSTTQKLYGRVIFGPFSGLPGTKSAMVWVTDHAKTFGTGAAPAPPATGPVI